MSCICRTCLSEITSNRYVDINLSEFARKQFKLCIPELNLDLVLEPVLCLKCVQALNTAYDFKSCCLQTEQRIKAYMETLTIEQQHVELEAVLDNNYNGINSKAIHCGNDITNHLNAVHDHSNTRQDLEDYKDAKGECSVTSENCSDSFDDGLEVNHDSFKEESIKIEEYEWNRFIKSEMFDTGSDAEDIKTELDTKSNVTAMQSELNYALAAVNDTAADDIFLPKPSRSDNCEEHNESSGKNSSKSSGSLWERKMVLARMDISSAEEILNVDNYAVMNSVGTQVNKSSHLKCDRNIKTDNTAAIGAEADLHNVIDRSPLHVKHSNTSALSNSNTFANVSLQPFINSNNVSVKNQELSISSQFLNTIDTNSYKCDQCHYACSHKSSLKQHIRNHSLEKPYKCNVCNYACSKKGNLIIHIRNHTGEKPYKCDHCDYASSQKSNLIKHLRNYAGKKPYKCDQCDYACSQKTNFIAHIMRKHTGEKPYKCEQCDYTSPQKGNLVKHIRNHAGKKPYQCGHCDFACSTIISLRRHMRKHIEEKPYKCDQCDYASSNKSHLNYHLRTHTGEKPYKCGQCDYACSQKGNLIMHIRNHTGEKPYKCDQCDYASSQKSNLINHVRTHTGEKPYKCNQCKYACATSSHLNRHMKNHSGEKPYKCD